MDEAEADLQKLYHSVIRLSEQDITNSYKYREPLQLKSKSEIFKSLYLTKIRIIRLLTLLRLFSKYKELTKSLINLENQQTFNPHLSYKSISKSFNAPKVDPSKIIAVKMLAHSHSKRLLVGKIHTVQSLERILDELFNGEMPSRIRKYSIKGNIVILHAPQYYSVRIKVNANGDCHITDLKLGMPKNVDLPINFFKKGLSIIQKFNVNDKKAIYNIDKVLYSLWNSGRYIHIINTIQKIAPEFGATIIKAQQYCVVRFSSAFAPSNTFQLKIEYGKIILTSTTPMIMLPNRSFTESLEEKFSKMSSLYFCSDRNVSVYEVTPNTNFQKVFSVLQRAVFFTALSRLWAEIVTNIVTSTDSRVTATFNVVSPTITDSYISFSKENTNLCKIMIDQRTGETIIETEVKIPFPADKFIRNISDILTTLFFIIKSSSLTHPKIFTFNEFYRSTDYFIKLPTCHRGFITSLSCAPDYSVESTKGFNGPQIKVTSKNTGETFNSGVLFTYQNLAMRSSLPSIEYVISDAKILMLKLQIKDLFTRAGFLSLQFPTGVVAIKQPLIVSKLRINETLSWSLKVMLFGYDRSYNRMNFYGKMITSRFSEWIVKFVQDLMTFGDTMMRIKETEYCPGIVSNSFYTNIFEYSTRICGKTTLVTRIGGFSDWTVDEAGACRSLDVLNADIHSFRAEPFSVRLRGRHLSVDLGGGNLSSWMANYQQSAILRGFVPMLLILRDIFDAESGWTMAVNIPFVLLVFHGAFTVSVMMRPQSLLIKVLTNGMTGFLRMHSTDIPNPMLVTNQNDFAKLEELKRRAQQALVSLRTVIKTLPIRTLSFENNRMIIIGPDKKTRIIYKPRKSDRVPIVKLANNEIPEMAQLFKKLKAHPLTTQSGFAHMIIMQYKQGFRHAFVAILNEMVDEQSIRWEKFIQGLMQKDGMCQMVFADTDNRRAVLLLADNMVVSCDRKQHLSFVNLVSLLKESTDKLGVLTNLYPDYV